MSIVYHLAEDVKQYVEIKSVSSRGGSNSMKISNIKTTKHCIKANEDQRSEGRVHYRSIVEIDGNIEKLTNA
jgi:hypothetical protein